MIRTSAHLELFEVDLREDNSPPLTWPYEQWHVRGLLALASQELTRMFGPGEAVMLPVCRSMS